MIRPWKPAGYNSVSPYLTVSDAKASLAFLEAVFSAKRLRLLFRPDGSLMHGEMQIDDTVVMLSEATSTWPGVPAHVHIYVDDVDATYQRALAAGGTSIMAPSQKDDEDKRGGVQDAGGTTWWIATQVEMP